MRVGFEEERAFTPTSRHKTLPTMKESPFMRTSPIPPTTRAFGM
jgi:hypothetical protein